MKLSILMAGMMLILLLVPAVVSQPVYIDANYGKSWLISTGNTQSDLWNWGTLPKGEYYEYPYGNWMPAILMMDYYPGGVWPYYLSVPWQNNTAYNPILYSFPPRIR